MHNIAFVVPTKDREKDLRVMLSSLRAQTHIPEQIIIVDGSDPVIKHVIDEFPELPIDYVRVFPASLSRQRNVGMAQLRDDITLAGYLDDDLELEVGAVEEMLVFWNTSGDEYGGASFSITNSVEPNQSRFMQWLDLDSTVRGRVLRSGRASMLGNVQQNVDVDWLCGGATVWKRGVVEAFQYDDWFQGTGFMEDVDFSYNVRGQYKLALVAQAKTAHYHHPIKSDRYVLLGKWQITNRLYFVRKYRHRGLSLARAWLVSPIIVFLNLSLSIVRRDMDRLRCAKGNVLGIWLSLFYKDKQIGGHLK